MDWIERIFGINPDGGNGAVEAALSLAILTTIVILALAWRSSQKRPTKD